MGKEAARELYYHVSGSFSLTREEVGNSGSPVNGDIDPTPLPTPSDDSESSAGDLMTSNIEPITQGGLDLERSDSSISGCHCAVTGRSSGRTAGVCNTSLSGDEGRSR